ncbi:MAG: translocation/assembly module TamB domain-containing protein [Candidatus Eisenbacteria bacterium]
MDQPTKRGIDWRRRLPLRVTLPVGLLLFLGALCAAPFLLVRIPGVRDPLLDLVPLGSLIGKESRIRVAHVVRFDPFGLRFEQVRVETREQGRWTAWGKLGTLELYWRPQRFFARRVDVIGLDIDSLSVDLEPLPKRAHAEKPSIPERLHLRLGLPPIDVGYLSIDHAELWRGSRQLLSARLWLQSVHHEAGDLRAILSEATVRFEEDSLRVSLLGGRLHGREVGVASLDSARAVWTGGSADLSVELDASQAGATRLRGAARQFNFEPARFTPLRRLALPLRGDDLIAGDIEVDLRLPPGGGPRGGLDLALRGNLFGAPVDTLDLVAEGSIDTAEVRALLLKVGSLQLEGKGEWRTRARAARVDLAYSGLDLAGDPLSRFVHGLPETRLRGELVGQVDSIGPRLRVRARLHSRPGVIRGKLLEGFRAALRLDPDSLWVDSLRVGEEAVAEAMARGVLSRRSQELRAAVHLEGLSLGRWVEPRVPIALEGAARGDLRLDGSIKRPRLSGELAVGEGRVEQVRFAALAARGIEGTLAPLDLSLELALDHPDIYGLKFDGADARGTVGPVIAASIAAWRDTTRIDLHARVRPTTPGWVDVDSLRAVAGSLPPVALRAPARIELGRSRVSLDSARVGSGDAEARGWGWIEPRPGHAGTEPFEFSLRGRSVDLALVAAFLRLPPDTLRGVADVTLHGEGTLHAPRYSGEFSTGRTEVYGAEFTEVGARFRAGELEPNRSRLAIDTLNVGIDTNRGRLAFGLRAQMGPQRPRRPARLHAESLELGWDRSWLSTLAGLRSAPLVLLEQATLQGDLSLTKLPIEVNLKRRSRGLNEAATASFVDPVDPMTLKVHEIHPDDEPAVQGASEGVRGTVEASAHLGGTGRAPLLDATLSATDLLVLQSSADSAQLAISYRDSLLRLERFDWTLHGVHTSSEGRVPLRLSLAKRPFELLPESLYVKTTVPEVDLGLATLFTNLILQPRATLTGEVELKGVHPHLVPGGHLTVTNGSFRVPAREERFTDINAELGLGPGGVTIEEAHGKVDGAGSLTARGRYKNDKDFDVRGTIRNVTVYESGNYRFNADGEVWAHPVVDGDSLRPELSGTVRADRGLITMDLTKQKEQKVLRTPFLINLQVMAPDNLKLVDPRTNLDLAVDSLRVRYRMPNWNYSGEVKIVGGRYRVFSYYFRVTSGTVRFIDSGLGPQPILDIVAETSVKDEADNLVNVTAHVTGEAIAPEIALSADGGRSGDEVVRLLTYGQSGRLSGRSSDNPASALAGGELWGVLEQQLISQLPFFERVQVQQAGAGDPWQISIRPISTRQWNVNYTQELVDKAKQSVNVNYRLGNLWFLNASYQKDFEGQGSLNETFDLDLRFRLEY